MILDTIPSKKYFGETLGVEMMPRSASYHEQLIKDLKDTLEAASYIEDKPLLST
jgi:hypothetical protein